MGIEGISSENVAKVEIYSLNGNKLNSAVKGVNIMKLTRKDGSVVVKKVVLK